MVPSPRENIKNLKAAVHGGIHDTGILDFSVSVNPFPPAPSVLEAFQNADVSLYPDSGSAALRKTLSRVYGMADDELLVTNGTSQAFWLIGLTYLNPADTSLIFSPGYGDYKTVTTIMGSGIIEYRLHAENNFHPDIQDLCDTIERKKPKLIWLCNPSNPTGAYLDPESVEKILDAATSYGGLLILDEAYIYFVMSSWNSFELIRKGNLIISRSMTKDFGIPGLRLGYIAASANIISQIAPVQPPWSVNTPAQDAGIQAVLSLPYYSREWERIAGLTDSFADDLRSLGFTTIPTRSNFMLFITDPAQRIADRLKEFSIIVRDCASFGLPGYIRVGTRLPEENAELIDALRSLLERDGTR